jgi:hypothetical protein
MPVPAVPASRHEPAGGCLPENGPGGGRLKPASVSSSELRGREEDTHCWSAALSGGSPVLGKHASRQRCQHASLLAHPLVQQFGVVQGAVAVLVGKTLTRGSAAAGRLCR